MYIAELEVKNYRSIEKAQLKILEPRITCLIGGNGSGKSNVLKAISALKDDANISDDFRYVGARDSEPITVAVKILFSEDDKSDLESLGLSLGSVSGMEVIKTKTKGQAPATTVTPIDYSGTIENKLARTIKEVRTNLSPNLDDAAKEALLAPFEALLDEEQSKADRLAALEAIRAKATELGILDDPLTQSIEAIKYDLENDINTRIKKLYDKIAIELLSFDKYTVEHEAPISELQDREKHPMLFDLLLLSDKSAADFEAAQGNSRVNVSEAASEKIRQEIKRVWPTNEIKVIINKDQADQFLSFCARTPQNKAVLLKDLSDGEQWFLRFYTRLATARLENKKIIWLFDEPDRGLHAKSQIDLRQFIEDISKDSQILYSTHQPNMIQWHKLERIFVVENTKPDNNGVAGTIVHKRFWKDSEFKSPLREVLRLFIGDDVLWGDEHVIVEGPSDYFFLTGWLEYLRKVRAADVWEKDYVTPHRTFIPVNGANNIPYFLFFLTRASSGDVNWFALVDSGSDYKEVQTVMGKGTLKKFKSKVATIIDLVPQVAPVSKGSPGTTQPAVDIEDLFKPEEYFEEFEKHYAAFYPETKLPKFKDIKTGKKQIAKQIEDLVKKLNPEFDKTYTLDKTGIAQSVYIKLVRTRKDAFSKDSEDNFAELLKNINKHFKK